MIPGGGTSARNLEHLVETRYGRWVEWEEEEREEEETVDEVRTFDNMVHSRRGSPSEGESPATKEYPMMNGFENTFKPMRSEEWDSDEP